MLAGELSPFALASAHLANHETHLVELLKQLVDFLDGRTTTTSDTFAPAAIDDLRTMPFLSSHGKDHCFDMLHLVTFQSFFHLWHGSQLVEARHHLHDLSQRSHTPELAHGAEEIIEVELALL